MKRLASGLALFLIVAFCLLPVQTSAAEKDMKKDAKAETQQKARDDRDRPHPASATPMKMSEITGDTVKNTKGEQLGTIQDLVVGPDGQVQYMILSHGGWLNIGDRLFAIPWEAARPASEPNTYIVNIDRDRLAKAPNFDRNTWPNFADPNVYNLHYGYFMGKEAAGKSGDMNRQKTGSP